MPLTIREQSEQLKVAAAEQLPAEVLEVFDRSIEDFLERGIPTDSIKAGDVLQPFTLDDATGTPVSLDEIVELLPQLGAFGARLVAISPQSPDESLSTVEKAALKFTVLSDPGARLADRLGVAFEQADDVLAAQRKLGLDLTKVNAEGAVRLPRPTVLVVDQDRTVRFVDVQPDYTARTEVADIIAALGDLT
jgi:peroxiredoxin